MLRRAMAGDGYFVVNTNLCEKYIDWDGDDSMLFHGEHSTYSICIIAPFYVCLNSKYKLF